MKKRTLSLQEMFRLYLALPGYSNQLFFFLLTFLSLLCGIPALVGVFLSLVFIRPFDPVLFLVSLLILSWALNTLTFLLLSKYYIKRQALAPISDYTSEQILTTMVRIIGLMVCPLLLPITALLEVKKSSR